MSAAEPRGAGASGSASGGGGASAVAEARPAPSSRSEPSPNGRPTLDLARPPSRRRSALRFAQSIPSAFEALRANKGRAILTTLGIVIGVAAVITIVALGQGSTAQVTSQLSNLGTNVLTISAGSSRNSGIRGGAGTSNSLKVEDADAIAERIAGTELISPIVSGNAQIIAGNQNWQTRVQGVRPAYQQIQSWKIETGGFFDTQDDAAARNVAVIGQTVATNLFPGGTSPVGQYVRIRNVPFTVVGVLASKGTGFGGDQDDTVLIPFQTAQVRLFGASNINQIQIQASSPEELTRITREVSALMRTRHRLQSGQPDDFTIRNNNDLLNTVQGVSQTMTLLLGGVAAVSLVVGGIGIMNIMLVSVTERTREIGIRMAIGARGSDIQAQFLIEAIVLACIGGIIGIGVGILASYAVRNVLGYATSVPLYAILLSFGFSALVGIFFGIYPARKASKLDPIDALRYQ